MFKSIYFVPAFVAQLQVLLLSHVDMSLRL